MFNTLKFNTWKFGLYLKFKFACRIYSASLFCKIFIFTLIYIYIVPNNYLKLLKKFTNFIESVEYGVWASSKMLQVWLTIFPRYSLEEKERDRKYTLSSPWYWIHYIYSIFSHARTSKAIYLTMKGIGLTGQRRE